MVSCTIKQYYILYYNTVVENYTGYCCYFQFDPIICSLWYYYLMVTVAKRVSVLWVGG